MPTIQVQAVQGVDLYTNPLLTDGSRLYRSINVESDPYGAKSKRAGYTTFLGTADGAQVNSLWSWTKNDGTTLTLYRASGSEVYSSAQGTGAWTNTGNGTIANGAYVGHAVLDDTMIIGDGSGSTRHTTDGTSFTNTSLAPVSNYFEQYQNRIYAAGTSSDLFYSTTGAATDWSSAGTSDSSSLVIPGAGKLGVIYKTGDRLIATKNSGLMYRWDGFSLVDMATEQGPTSPESFAQVEDYGFYINRLGHFGHGGARPELLSNAVQNYFYNRSGSAVPGTHFGTAVGEVHKYDYYVTLGTVTDTFTEETMSKAILKYNYQQNEYGIYTFNDFPTSMHSYTDASGDLQMIFGDTNGQCYKLDPTSTSDNGSPIEAVMEFLLVGGRADLAKKWNWFEAFFNPGCQARVQFAVGDTFHKGAKNWRDFPGDFTRGHNEFRFPEGTRGKLMYIKITDKSTTSKMSFYGMAVDMDFIKQK